MKKEENFGTVKIDKLYRLGETREDKITKLPKGRYLYDGSFVLFKDKQFGWVAEDVEAGMFLCDGDTLEHLLDEVEKRLNPDFQRGVGVPC